MSLAADTVPAALPTAKTPDPEQGPSPSSPPPEGSRAKRLLIRYGPVLVVFVLFIGLWYAMHYIILDENRRFIVPPPHDVVDEAFLNDKARAELFEGLVNTTRIALYGFVIASVLALAGATLMALNRTIERALYPYAVVLQTIPILALVPLFVVWFGPSRTARVVTCVLVALFPILTSFLFGLKSVDSGHKDLFQLQGVGWFTRYRKLQLPAALPSIFTGLRIGAGLCVVGALVADFFFCRGDLGLGRLLNNYAKELQYERLFGGVILASLLGVSIYAFIGWLSHRSLRNWHESEAVRN
ncbi:MAG: ABC transporter permease [Acidimicrobiia bacterium]|nr:ABC transporter permease [Acidimicrobiia bacterium]